jgi:hypothetical protein
LANFKRFLNDSSGNDPLELIAAYMCTREAILLRKERNEVFLNGKMRILVDSLKKQHELAPGHEKRRWLSFVATLLTMEELQQLGWHINSHSFRNARKHIENYGAGAKIPKPPIPPSKRTILELQKIVEEFFYQDEISRISPNNFTNKKQVNDFVLNINFLDNH